ncbi:hypothetical protein NPIL_590311 [Nephila pilipes]|uniref:Uncharacterized protein n=1 Tax=Nephila pilipes TaxID=299642 RepID=A0A8X6TN69_NEPPI|nr:hypothetical protein NPIL_590311 [Nephila pilipes]
MLMNGGVNHSFSQLKFVSDVTGPNSSIASIIVSMAVIESSVIMMFAFLVLADPISFATLHENFYTTCLQPFDLNSALHRLPPFADRCPHCTYLPQSKTVLPRVAPIWSHPCIA